MKKILSFVLALCMICTLLPATALTANAATEDAKLSFANKAQRTSFSTSKQVWEQNGITFTNNKGSSTSSVADYASPVRLYAKSNIAVEAPGNITKIIFDCNNATYATAMKNSIGTVAGATVAVSSDKVTITFTTAAESFTVASLTAQVRLDSLTVTYTVAEAACQHENKTVVTKAANCTEAGETSWECPDCGEKKSETIPALGHKYGDFVVVEEATCTKPGSQEKTCERCGDTVKDTIPLAEHNYEDGECTECGAEEPNEVIFEFGANGTASHYDGTGKTSYTETVGDYTLTLSNLSNVYGGARDAKGNSCLNLGASGKAGSFRFKAPDDIISVKIAIAGYKDSTATITVNGTPTVLKKTSNSGEYDLITVDTSTTKEVSLSVTSGYRAMVNSITFVYADSDEQEVPATATFNGAAADISGNVGDTITMPEYTGTVMKGYTFAGWSKDIVEGETQNIEIEQAGVSYDLTGEDDAFYALFSRTEKVDVTDTYKLHTGELVAGDYLIVNKSGNRAMTATIDKNRFQYANVSVAEDDTIQISDASAIWHIIPNGGYYTFYNAASGKYAGGSGEASEGALLGSVTDYALWAVTNGDTVVVENKGNKVDSVNYTLRNNNTYGFATYAPNTGDAPAFYKAVNEAIYYTTNPQAILYTNGSNLTKYNAWNEELSNATSGKIILCDDITVNTVDLNAGVVLDLNGCTVNASRITATVKDSADGKGLIKIAQKSAVLTSVNGQLILWDNTRNASGYRAFNYTFANRGVDADGTDAEQTASAGILVKSFWSDLEFSNANAYMLVATSDLNVGFKLSLDGEKFTEYKFDRGASDDVIAKWGADEANNPENKNYCFYIKVTGFEALEGNGKLWVMPFVTTTHSTVNADAVSYSYTVE